MARQEMAEKLNTLLSEAKQLTMEPGTSRRKLNEAFGYATLLSGKVSITNPNGVVLWINVLMKKLINGREVTNQDLICYCKIILDILDPDDEVKFTRPRPKHCI